MENKKEEPKKEGASEKKNNKKQSVTELLAQEELVSCLKISFLHSVMLLER